MPNKTHSERYLIFTLAAVQFTYMMDFVVMMPLGPQLMRGLSIGASEFSLLVSIYTLAAGLASLLAGFYIDRFDRRTTLLCLYVGFLLATLLCGLAPDYPALLVARACAGAIGGVMGSTIHSILGDAIPDSRRGAATGVVMSAFSVAAITGVPAGLWLASASDWHAPFLMLTVLSLAILAGAWRVVPSFRGHLQPGAQKIHPLRQAQAVFADANHRRALTLGAALDLGGFLVVPFIGAYMIGNVGLKEHELPFLYLFGGLATVFTSRWIGRLADRYGKKQVFTITVCIALLPLLTLTHLPPAPLWAAICTMVAFMVFFSGRFVSAMALINSSAQPSLRGSFLSFNAAIQQFSLSIAALVGGYIIGTTDTGALANFGTAGILSALIAILSIALAWRVKPVG
jgi:predicted MFS family arabinose efflux permease